MAWVRVPFLTFCRHCYTKYCIFYIEHLQMVLSTIIHAIDHSTYRWDGHVVWSAGLRHQSLQWRGFVSHSCHFVDIPIQSIVSFILNTCTWYLLSLFRLLTTKHTGRMAEWSKALFLGTSHFGGVGSSPTPVILLTLLYKVLFPVFWTPAHGIFHPCHWLHNIQAGWPSGLRRWF